MPLWTLRNLLVWGTQFQTVHLPNHGIRENKDSSLYFQVTAPVIPVCSMTGFWPMKLKDSCSLEEKLWQT